MLPCPLSFLSSPLYSSHHGHARSHKHTRMRTPLSLSFHQQVTPKHLCPFLSLFFLCLPVSQLGVLCSWCSLWAVIHLDPSSLVFLSSFPLLSCFCLLTLPFPRFPTPNLFLPNQTPFLLLFFHLFQLIHMFWFQYLFFFRPAVKCYYRP